MSNIIRTSRSGQELNSWVLQSNKDSDNKIVQQNFAKLEEKLKPTLERSKDFDFSEEVYENGDRSSNVKYNNNVKSKTRNCSTHDIIKNADYNQNQKKITWDYTTSKSYGIGIVKEKNTNGKWVAKIYEKLNYSHPEDNPQYNRFLKERFINPQSEFCKSFEGDKLIFDSTKKYSEEYINKLLSKYELPSKAINLLKKFCRA